MSASTDSMALSTMYVGSSQQTPMPYAGSNPHASSLGGSTATVNQTLGWVSNYTVPYHYRIARWRGGYENSIKNDQLVFLRTTNDKFIKGGQNNMPNYFHNQVHTMVNLPMVNYAIYKDWLQFETDVANGDYDQELGRKPNGDFTLDKYAYFMKFYVLERWQFLGTVINEGAPMAADTDANTEHRLINSCIRGRQTTFNIWGAIRDGDYLYLKLCLKDTKGTDFQLDLKNFGGRMPDLASRRCFQFVPFYNHTYKRPDINGNSEPHHYIYVGRCFRTQRGVEMDYDEEETMRRCREVSHMAARSISFEILVDPIEA